MDFSLIPIELYPAMFHTNAAARIISRSVKTVMELWMINKFRPDDIISIFNKITRSVPCDSYELLFVYKCLYHHTPRDFSIMVSRSEIIGDRTFMPKNLTTIQLRHNYYHNICDDWNFPGMYRVSQMDYIKLLYQEKQFVKDMHVLSTTDFVDINDEFMKSINFHIESRDKHGDSYIYLGATSDSILYRLGFKFDAYSDFNENKKRFTYQINISESSYDKNGNYCFKSLTENKCGGYFLVYLSIIKFMEQVISNIKAELNP